MNECLYYWRIFFNFFRLENYDFDSQKWIFVKKMAPHSLDSGGK